MILESIKEISGVSVFGPLTLGMVFILGATITAIWAILLRIETYKKCIDRFDEREQVKLKTEVFVPNPKFLPRITIGGRFPNSADSKFTIFVYCFLSPRNIVAFMLITGLWVLPAIIFCMNFFIDYMEYLE